jgi:hypothetical protein
MHFVRCEPIEKGVFPQNLFVEIGVFENNQVLSSSRSCGTKSRASEESKPSHRPFQQLIVGAMEAVECHIVEQAAYSSCPAILMLQPCYLLHPFSG